MDGNKDDSLLLDLLEGANADARTKRLIAMKAHRKGLRREIDEQIKIAQNVIEHTQELLGSRENYIQASHSIDILKKLDASIANLEEIASRLDKELIDES